MVALCSDLVPQDRRRVTEILGRELADAGYSFEGLLPRRAAPRGLEALEGLPAAAGIAATARGGTRRLRSTDDILTPGQMGALANVGSAARALGTPALPPQAAAGSSLEVLGTAGAAAPGGDGASSDSGGNSGGHRGGGAPPAVGSGPASAPAPDPRMSMTELQALLRDPEVPDRELRPYFRIDTERSRPFAPELAFDSTRVAIDGAGPGLEGAMFMGWANQMARWRRQRRFELRLKAGDTRPVLVSEGDSWFQFPIYLEDTIDHLSARFNIYSVDAAGDTLQNMVLESAEYLSALRRHRQQVRALLFSGAGNDILGDDVHGRPQLLGLLRRFEAGRDAAWYLAHEPFDAKLRFVESSYRRIFETVAHEFPGLPVICHGYDHAVPGGYPGDPRRPSWAAQDQWLGAPLRQLGVQDPALQQDILRHMINRLNQRLRGLCGGNQPGGAYAHAWLVDARGAVNGRWADELHPQDEGYASVAERFAGVIHQALGLPLAAARAAAPAALEAVAHDDCQVDEEAPPDHARAHTMGVATATAGSPGALETTAARPWRVAGALLALRGTVNAMAPARSKRSDGTVGDAAHAARTSDHNPWVVHQGRGVVTAMDITHDPAGGCDAGRLAESLRSSRDARIKYVIWDRRIFSATVEPWVWRPYNGRNPHSHHVHISVRPEPGAFDDGGAWPVSV